MSTHFKEFDSFYRAETCGQPCIAVRIYMHEYVQGPHQVAGHGFLALLFTRTRILKNCNNLFFIRLASKNIKMISMSDERVRSKSTLKSKG